ncbi:MAG: hypothetical protein HKL95_00380, partial [Phycisphaerae bacterium]|nr:hypothetical protein [Phycisphaerae bacterium]
MKNRFLYGSLIYWLAAVVLGSLLVVASAGPVAAMGVRDIRMGPIQPVPQKITIDGRLGEWQSITGYTINPLTGNG